jgi:hypothetical protein
MKSLRPDQVTTEMRLYLPDGIAQITDIKHSPETAGFGFVVEGSDQPVWYYEGETVPVAVRR